MPNPIPPKSSVRLAMPAAEFKLEMPNKTAQLDTTTSFAEIPAIKATAICQYPSPSGAKKGTIHFQMTAPKLFLISEVYPEGPKFNKNHITIEAIKIVVPAFVRKSFTFSQT